MITTIAAQNPRVKGQNYSSKVTSFVASLASPFSRSELLVKVLPFEFYVLSLQTGGLY